MTDDSLEARFERCCRLCAEEQETTILLFGPKADEMLLQNKLNKYLLIEVEEDDKLPKNICIQCCNKLQSLCAFIDMARKAQDELTKRSLMLENTESDSHISIIKCEPDLYVYNDEEESNKTTKLEVNVDPMMVLQNNDETDTANSDCNYTPNNNHDITFLQYNEDVTIKLISTDKSEPVQNDTSFEEEEIKPFSCWICRRSFLTDLALKNHLWTHSQYDDKTGLYKCSICNIGFDFKSNLLAHEKKHRSEGLCQVCGRGFRTQLNLKAHMAIHNNPAINFTCRVCGRSYKTKSNLKTHSITHSTDRPFKCLWCKKSFKRNQDLKFHVNQHTGAKPYKCPFCDKSFASSGNCYSHRSRMHPGKTQVKKQELKKMRKKVSATWETTAAPQQIPMLNPKLPTVTVKGVQKYQCQVCSHSFIRKDNFTYHMFQHTGVKPFHCSFCEEKFITRRGLLIHHAKEHPLKDTPLRYLSKNALLK